MKEEFFNFDEVIRIECDKAIDECIQVIENSKTLSDNTTIWTMAEKCRLQNELRRLKGGCYDNRRN